MKNADQWQTTFDAITDLVLVLDKDFRIKRLNKAAAFFFQLPVEKILGRSYIDLMPGIIETSVESPFRKILETKKPNDSDWFLEDRQIWISVSAVPVLDDENNVVEVISIVKDITDRKKREDLYQKSEERYRSIFNYSPIGLIEMDGSAVKKSLEELSESEETDLGRYLDDHPEEARRLLTKLSMVDVNSTILNFMGYQKKEDYLKFLNQVLINADTKEIFADGSPGDMIFKGFKETIVNLRTGKNFYETEVAFPTGVGNKQIYFNIRWSIPSGYEETYTKVLVSISNITKIKRAEAALRESEDKYRNVIEKSLAGFFVVQGNAFRFVNQRFCDIFGYTFGEMVNTLSVLDLVQPESRPRVEESLGWLLEEKADSLESEMRMIHKDGKMVIVKVLLGSMGYDGKPAVTGTVIDVTKERNLEFQLHQAHKMEALGTLAGGIAHDFNNLLMTILGYTSLMLMDQNVSKEFHDHLKIIEGQVKSGSDLTRQLLGFARGGKYEVVPTNLNDLLTKNTEIFGRTKKEIRIFCRLEKDIWTVEVDRGQIEQVFLNLLVNAWQAMPAGGDLYLQTKNVIVDAGHASISYLKPGRYVKISVTDQGAGMDEATRQRIFEPFFTTQEMGRGTGLGLASAYGIIKNHGGAINVYSERGQGTTFNIYLPMSDKEVAAEKPVTHEILKGTETILLVDDQEAVVTVGERMLKALGYTVLTAQNGEAAVALYREEKKIDLVILDMIMPGMGGSEVFDALKSINPDIKVILSSGYSLNGQATKILSKGCRGFIQKPFSLADLSRKIQEAIL